MKKLRIVWLIAVWSCLLRAVSGQSFVNLDFERAMIAPTPPGGWGDVTEASQAFPGWSVASGLVLYNNVTIGSPAVSLLGPYFPQAVAYAPLQGSYSALIEYFGYSGPSPVLSQTGSIPVGARSISLLVASGTPASDVIVAMNGVNIPLISSAGERLAGDISSFAGSTVELALSAANPAKFVYFDDVQFSSVTVPEPTIFSLTFAAIIVFGCGRKGLQRRKNRANANRQI